MVFALMRSIICSGNYYTFNCTWISVCSWQ